MIVYEKRFRVETIYLQTLSLFIKYLPIFHGIAIKVVYFTISNRSTNSFLPKKLHFKLSSCA